MRRLLRQNEWLDFKWLISPMFIFRIFQIFCGSELFFLDGDFRSFCIRVGGRIASFFSLFIFAVYLYLECNGGGFCLLSPIYLSL